MRTWLAALTVAAMLAACSVLMLPGVAAAHAALVKASPARRATLTEPPARVELTFSERLEPAYARVAVEDERGMRVDLGNAAVSADDGRRLTLSLPALRPGAYTVRFRVLSVDGHVVESTYTFRIVPPRAGR